MRTALYFVTKLLGIPETLVSDGGTAQPPNDGGTLLKLVALGLALALSIRKAQRVDRTPDAISVGYAVDPTEPVFFAEPHLLLQHCAHVIPSTVDTF